MRAPDKLLYFPDIEQIAGTTASLVRFRALAETATDFETLQDAFHNVQPPDLLKPETLANHLPRLAAALDAFGAGDWASVAATLNAAESDVKLAVADLDGIHATIIAYLLGVADTRPAELALGLMKAIWARGLVADPKRLTDAGFDGPVVGYLARFWAAGGPVIANRLPRSRHAPWPKDPPQADPAAAPGGAAVAQGPKLVELESAVRELERLRDLQAIADAQVAPPPVQLPPPDPQRSSNLFKRLFAPGQRTEQAMAPASPTGVPPWARRLDPDIRSQISAAAAQTLAAQNVALDQTGITSAIDKLKLDLSIRYSQAELDPRIRDSLYALGRVVEINTDVFAEISCPPKPIPCYCDLLSELDAKHGGRSFIHVLGTGRAYRIDQTLLPYETGELVHTEPVLGGSDKKMSFRKLDRLEESEETDTERETFEESEATTHDQFSLSNEVSKTMERELDVQTGSSFTASYGGAISVSANFDASSTVGATLSERTAATSSKDVINKAIKSLRERVETRRTRKSLSETERKDSFRIRAPSGSFTGFYQAINKYYSNQLMCVGERAVARIAMNQPMAFLLASLAASQAEGVRLAKPVPPWENHPDLGTLKAFNDITQTNYGAWAALYEVEGLKPPPQPVSVGAETSADYQPGKSWMAGSMSVDLADGYECTSAQTSAVMSGGFYIHGHVASGYYYLGGGSAWVSFSPSVYGKVPISYRGHVEEYGLTYVLHCQPTAEEITKWKISVYDAILEAYRGKSDAYEAEVQAALVSGGISIEGQNPLKNRTLIEQELQKFVLGAVYPPLYYRGFDSMKFGAPCDKGGVRDLSRVLPDPDFADAYGEAPWLTFLTQIFEWKNMVYQFQPYYMAGREKWVTLRGLTDEDQLFENAVSAGHVLVDIPVAPHMTEPFFYFLQTGIIWDGGAMPVFGDPHFIDIATAIRLSETRDDAVVCTGVSPWITAVPTPLVYVTDTPPPNLV